MCTTQLMIVMPRLVTWPDYLAAMDAMRLRSFAIQFRLSGSLPTICILTICRREENTR